jgi:hypothetical protein
MDELYEIVVKEDDVDGERLLREIGIEFVRWNEIHVRATLTDEQLDILNNWWGRFYWWRVHQTPFDL